MRDLPTILCDLAVRLVVHRLQPKGPVTQAWRPGCDLCTTIEQPNRTRSHINHATSRGGRGQSHDQKQVFVHVQKPVAAISDHTQVLHSRTMVARPAVRLVMWSHDHLKTGAATSIIGITGFNLSHPIMRSVATGHDGLHDKSYTIVGKS